MNENNNVLNTVVCFLLIGAILVGFYFINRPSAEQIEANRRYYDSIAAAQQKEQLKEANIQELKAGDLFNETDSDSTKLDKASQRFGEFAAGALNEKKTVSLENNLMSIEFSTLGANIEKVVLKEYKDYKKNPLTLMNGDNHFSVDLPTVSNRVIPSETLVFNVAAKTDSSVTFSVATTNNGSFDFTYTLPSNSYMLGLEIRENNLGQVLRNNGTLNASWKLSLAQQEKGRTFENRYAQIYYHTSDGDTDYLSETSNDEEKLEESLHWIAFKDQYFSNVLIADTKIDSSLLKSSLADDSSKYLKHYTANFTLPLKNGDTSVGLRYFFGPNHYKLLKSYDENLKGDDKLELEDVISLGWMIFRWVNLIFTIPLFNLLGGFLSNYGIIILIMTIILKAIIFPLTYKSYLSTAKMKVLKPQIDEINARIPAENSMERSQATMELYQKAGVNPMGGCLPMLLQMPFLVAFFYFLPNAIELRGESFLWAEDLSTYDAIISWGPKIWLIGDHISLFCLLMTIANGLYTYYNMSVNNQSEQMGQFPFMKYMMYFMPVMFFFIFNDYASGLSYYYFVSLLITIIQTYVIKNFCVDEQKLLKKIQENQKKPSKPSNSSWLNRIAEMQKRQQEMMEEQRRAANDKK